MGGMSSPLPPRRQWYFVGSGPELRSILDFPSESFTPYIPSNVRILVERGKGQPGEQIFSTPISGYIEAIKDSTQYFCIILASGPPDQKLQLLNLIQSSRNPGLIWGSLAHPQCSISRNAKLGEGVILHPGAVVQGGAEIGNHVIIGPGSVIGPGCVVSDCVTIGANATLPYRNYVGYGAWVSSAVSISPKVQVGAWAKIETGWNIEQNVDNGELIGKYDK